MIIAQNPHPGMHNFDYIRVDGSISRSWLGIYIFMLGVATSVAIKIGPTLLMADILVLCTLPLATLSWARNPRRLPRRMWLIIGFSFLWLVASIVSNAVNHVTLFNWLRGVALIVVFTTALFVMGVLVAGNCGRERLYLLGWVLGLIASDLIVPKYSNFHETWKYELGIAISVGAAAWLDKIVRRRPAWLIFECGALLGVGLFSLLQGYRSLAGFLIFAAIIGVYKWRNTLSSPKGAMRAVPKSLSLGKAAKVVIIALTSLMAVSSLYFTAVESGWLGRRGTQRVERSEAQDLDPVLNVLLGSRPQILISGYAITRKPFLGFGSWPQNCEYIQKFKERENELGITSPVGLGFMYRNTRTPCLIPTHSHLIGAWVWSGILGVPIWLSVWVLTAWWIARAIGDRKYLELAPILIAADLLWAILFSPFAGQARITEALFIAIIFSRWGTRKAEHESIYRNHIIQSGEVFGASYNLGP